jgi:hypothetical protein
MPLSDKIRRVRASIERRRKEKAAKRRLRQQRIDRRLEPIKEEAAETREELRATAEELGKTPTGRVSTSIAGTLSAAASKTANAASEGADQLVEATDTGQARRRRPQDAGMADDVVRRLDTDFDGDGLPLEEEIGRASTAELTQFEAGGRNRQTIDEQLGFEP